MAAAADTRMSRTTVSDVFWDLKPSSRSIAAEAALMRKVRRKLRIMSLAEGSRVQRLKVRRARGV